MTSPQSPPSTQSPLPLDGRVVVVVGTSPNIGAGIAVGVAAAGATVVCVDRDPTYAERCAADIDGAIAAVVDATDDAAVAACVADVVARFGRVDGLVNGATRYDERGLLDLPVDVWRSQLEVLLTAPFLFTRHVASAMIAAGIGGAIVNLASTAGHQGQAGNIGYSSAKGGVLNFTQAAAMDLAPHGIRVNSITPTSTDTAAARDRAEAWGLPTDRWAPNDRADVRRRLLPLGAMPEPDDYANAVVFLLSDGARAITGTDLRVDAGAIARHWAADT